VVIEGPIVLNDGGRYGQSCGNAAEAGIRGFLQNGFAARRAHGGLNQQVQWPLCRSTVLKGAIALYKNRRDLVAKPATMGELPLWQIPACRVCMTTVAQQMYFDDGEEPFHHPVRSQFFYLPRLRLARSPTLERRERFRAVRSARRRFW